MKKIFVFLALLLLSCTAAAEAIPGAWDDMVTQLTDDVPVLQSGAFSGSPSSVLVIPEGYRKEMDLTEALSDSRISWVINRSGCRLTVPSDVRVFQDFCLTGLKAGDTIIFGHYPQSENGTDRTAIEWIVLSINKGKALLISKYGLDCCQYNEFDLNVQWKTCSLRKWLNTTFMDRAFTKEQQAAIQLTTLDNGHSQHLDFKEIDSDRFDDSGTFKNYDETYDRLFILSYNEAQHWFGSIYPGTENEEARLTPTAYAFSQGAEDNGETASGETAGTWWLRSPGARLNYAAVVEDDGDPNQEAVISRNVMVRPCFWMNLRALEK